MGPPKFAPNWLRLKTGFRKGTVVPVLLTMRGLKKPAALRSVLRMNSYSGACKWLVPLCEATLTVAPEERPYSALSLSVTTWNWATESGGTAIIWLSEPWLLSPKALLSRPSRRKWWTTRRPPLTLWAPAGVTEPTELVVAAVGAWREPGTSA